MLYTWGWNAFGQLGLGDTLSRNVPVHMGTGNNWKTVEAGCYHVLAQQTDGSLWAWGYNFYGQLGLGDIVDRTMPVQVGTNTDWTLVSCGCYHNLAVKPNGTLLAWGNNELGQLGDNTQIEQHQPVLINGQTNMVVTGAGYFHSAIIKSDLENVCVSGYSELGQLGEGGTTGSLPLFRPNFGCTETIPVDTSVSVLYTYFPTAFSPNGDGVNDVFKAVKYPPFKNFRLSIYNRWGEKVFETTNAAEGWNGVYKDVAQPLGVYVWMAAYTFADGNSENRSGNVSLVR